MKKDLGLILIGVCFGMFICSILMFVAVWSVNSPNRPSSTKTSSVPLVSTQLITPARTKTNIPTITDVLETPTVTSTPTITYTPTKTPAPTKTFTPTRTSDMRSLYKSIPNKELYTYADNYVGEQVVVRGMVFNINNTKELQIFAGGSSNYPMYLVFDSSFSGIYEDDYITAYVVVGGTECGTNAFGGEICQPLLFVDFWEKK